MNLAIVATVLPIVALGELPDKTMFASLLMASRGRAGAVWLGAAAAFTVHVVIAVSIGVALFKVLPHRAVDSVVAALFLGGAVYSFLIRNQREEAAGAAPAGSRLGTAATAAAVTFLAEWGDLTQILTANLAARYHSPVSVGIGALAGLWIVAAIAVTSGAGLLRILSVRTLRLVTAGLLGGLGVYSAIGAAGG